MIVTATVSVFLVQCVSNNKTKDNPSCYFLSLSWFVSAIFTIQLLICPNNIMNKPVFSLCYGETTREEATVCVVGNITVANVNR